MTSLNIGEMPLSKVATSLLWLDGKPFSFRNYEMFKAIYDGRYPTTLLKTSRQVGKSTSMSNFTISESIAIPFFRSLYAAPTQKQTTTYSSSRIGKVLEHSPLVQKHFQSSKVKSCVFAKGYLNGSENYFTYCSDDPDRTRGYTADRILLDEVQDMVLSEVLPVITASMKASKYRFEMFAGTPKTLENPLESLWDKSTKSEWIMKCSGCGSYSYVASEKAIGKRGPICIKCGKYLNPREGFWVDTAKPQPPPSWDPSSGVAFRYTKGFHICQPVMPMNVPLCNPGHEDDAQSRWNDILTDMENCSPSKFKNEVLGISDAVGARLLTIDELKALCIGPRILPKGEPHGNMKGVTVTFAGIDWSGGGASGSSRTVLWIWGYVPSEAKLRTLFYKIYSGSNPVLDVKDIAMHIANYHVHLGLGDAGCGFLANASLKELVGKNRIQAAEYGAQKEACKIGVDRYHVNRTTMIDNYMMVLKKGGVTFPPYAESQEPIKDILNEFEEVTHSGRKVWNHSPSQPDDCLHAQVFGWLAWKITMGDNKFY